MVVPPHVAVGAPVPPGVPATAVSRRGPAPFVNVHLLGHDWGAVLCWEAVCEPDAGDRIASRAIAIVRWCMA